MQAGLPLDAADLATHVLWKLERRPDVLRAIPELVGHVERCGCVEHLSRGVDDKDIRDVAVRSIFALTSLCYNQRLRDRVLACPGFLVLVSERALASEEPSMAVAYLGLLYRLTFRHEVDGLRAPETERLLEGLVDRVCAAGAGASTRGVATVAAVVDPAPSLGVLANVTRGSLAARAYLKAQTTVTELYKVLARLLVGPGVLCIMYALQSLANLVLHEALGATLFGEDNVRRIFDLVFSLVKEGDQSDQAHQAMRAASDLLKDLFLSAPVLQLVERLGGAPPTLLEWLLGAIATRQHSYDLALPLLEIASSLLRPPVLRAQLQAAIHSERAVHASVLGAILALAACPHTDAACAAAGLLAPLVRDNEAFGHTLGAMERSRAIESLVEAADLTGGPSPGFWPVLPESGGGKDDSFLSGRRRQAACVLLRELAQTKTFGDDLAGRFHLVPLVSAARVASQSGDGGLMLAVLLLALACGQHGMSAAEQRELLLFARSPAVVDVWAKMLTDSTNAQALQECILVAYHVLAAGEAADGGASPATGGISATSVKDTSTLVPSAMGALAATSTPVVPLPQPLSSGPLPVPRCRGRLALGALTETLAQIHHARLREVESLRSRLRLLEEKRKADEDAAERRDTEQRRVNEEQLDQEGARGRQYRQELHALTAGLQEERHRAELATAAKAHEAESLARAQNQLEFVKRQVQEGEIKHADLLQRAARAEGLCRQLGGKAQDKDDQLQRALADRDHLQGEAQQLQHAERALVEVRDAERAAQIHCQQQYSTLAEVRECLENELYRSKRDADDRVCEAQRKAALLEGRADDLDRRLAGASVALRSVEVERDDALREVSWLRCELAAQQRWGSDRGQRLAGRLDAELDTTHGELGAAERRLWERERADRERDACLAAPLLAGRRPPL